MAILLGNYFVGCARLSPPFFHRNRRPVLPATIIPGRELTFVPISENRKREILREKQEKLWKEESTPLFKGWWGRMIPHSAISYSPLLTLFMICL